MSDVVDAEDAIDLPYRQKPEIEFRNVSFKYQEKTILDNVSFTLEGGKTLGLVGGKLKI
jgi:ABC-type multidrug transport system fused ATPase/permease subunit